MAATKKPGLWSDVDDVATFAHQVCEDIRESDTRALHDRLTVECARRPGQMAQALMALAAWVNILQHLPEISRVSLKVEEQLRVWVRVARERKITWAQIGAALDITRQSAWERFKEHL